MSPVTSLKIFFIGCGLLSVALTLISQNRLQGLLMLFIFCFSFVPRVIDIPFSIIQSMSKRATAQGTIGQLEWKCALFALAPYVTMAVLGLVVMRLRKPGRSDVDNVPSR